MNAFQYECADAGIVIHVELKEEQIPESKGMCRQVCLLRIEGPSNEAPSKKKKKKLRKPVVLMSYTLTSVAYEKKLGKKRSLRSRLRSFTAAFSNTPYKKLEQCLNGEYFGITNRGDKVRIRISGSNMFLVLVTEVFGCDGLMSSSHSIQVQLRPIQIQNQLNVATSGSWSMFQIPEEPKEEQVAPAE